MDKYTFSDETNNDEKLLFEGSKKLDEMQNRLKDFLGKAGSSEETKVLIDNRINIAQHAPISNSRKPDPVPVIPTMPSPTITPIGSVDYNRRDPPLSEGRPKKPNPTILNPGSVTPKTYEMKRFETAGQVYSHGYEPPSVQRTVPSIPTPSRTVGPDPPIDKRPSDQFGMRPTANFKQQKAIGEALESLESRIQNLMSQNEQFANGTKVSGNKRTTTFQTSPNSGNKISFGPSEVNKDHYDHDHHRRDLQQYASKRESSSSRPQDKAFEHFKHQTFQQPQSTPTALLSEKFHHHHSIQRPASSTAVEPRIMHTHHPVDVSAKLFSYLRTNKEMGALSKNQALGKHTPHGSATVGYGKLDRLLAGFEDRKQAWLKDKQDRERMANDRNPLRVCDSSAENDFQKVDFKRQNLNHQFIEPVFQRAQQPTVRKGSNPVPFYNQQEREEARDYFTKKSTHTSDQKKPSQQLMNEKAFNSVSNGKAQPVARRLLSEGEGTLSNNKKRPSSVHDQSRPKSKTRQQAEDLIDRLADMVAHRLQNKLNEKKPQSKPTKR